jgi:hypothetical protein
MLQDVFIINSFASKQLGSRALPMPGSVMNAGAPR